MFQTKTLIAIVSVVSMAAVSTPAATIHVPAEQPTIQAGIDTAISGDTVLVADGTYTGPGNRDILFDGKAVVLKSENGPLRTIVDAGGDAVNPYRVFIFESGETASTVVEGITISGGYSDDSFSFSQFRGGAVICNSSSPTFKNCRIVDNTGHHGGAFYITDGASPRFYDCFFGNNVAGDIGGAVLVRFESAAHFDHCDFDGNSALNGGAFLCYNASPSLESCTFVNNSGSLTGGAVFLQDNSSPEFTNCTMFGNNSPGGGAVFVEERGAVGGLAAPLFTNCILAFNGPDAAILSIDAAPRLVCSDVFGNTGGDWVGDIAAQLASNGNFSLDPLFCGAAGGVHLKENSPCAAANNGCGVVIGALDVGCFICADANGDSMVTLDDLDFLIAFYFAFGPAPEPTMASDLNCSGSVDLADIVLLAQFLNGEEPQLCCLDGPPNRPRFDPKKKRERLGPSFGG